MASTDFILNHVRRGQQSLSWSETTRLSVGLRGLSWSETPRLSVGLRVQVRRRVAGDDPRTDQNNDGKGVKRAEVPPAKLSWLPGGCFSVWSSVCVSGSWSCTCLLSVPVLGAGWWSRVPWPLPSWLAAAPVCLVPASVLVFVRKGDVPRTDPVVPLPVRASFRYSLVCWQYWSVDIEGVFLRWYSFDDFWQSVSTRFQPTGGGRWKNLRVQSGLSVEVYVSFYVSLVSAFCFHCAAVPTCDLFCGPKAAFRTRSLLFALSLSCVHVSKYSCSDELLA